ncbi:MAG: hypothetical protein OXH23_00315 [bacterium]|nr:hypothetical protein [bacterium]
MSTVAELSRTVARRQRRRLGLAALAVGLLAALVPAAGASAQWASDGRALARQEIEVRDQLIAEQESLLNAYRCRFDVDVQLVPGGCADGQPAGGPVQPGVFEGEPRDPDITERDILVLDQEWLLNAYRCRFDVDVQLVPVGGCLGPAIGVGPYTAVSPSGSHTCAIQADQTIACWGLDSFGKADSPDGQFTAIAAGAQHTCAIRTDQTIACWGYDPYYDSWDRIIPPDGQFTAIAAGAQHTCAIRADQTIACWGHEFYPDGKLQPPDGAYTAVVAGNRLTCAIRTDQTIGCWGENYYHRARPPEGRFTAIAAGPRQTCAIRTDGAIACWGEEFHGSYLRFEGAYTPSTNRIPDGEFTAIAVAYDHACAIRADQTIACWGHATVVGGGKLWKNPALTPPDGEFTAIASKSRQFCAIRDDGAIACWGHRRINSTGRAGENILTGTYLDPPDSPS